MSKGYWQTKRQKEQFAHGNSLTQRVKDYISTWEKRCYFNGIPEECSDLLMNSGRCPSYKALAFAILKNDHNLYSVGFSQKNSEILNSIIQINKKQELEKIQPSLF